MAEYKGAAKEGARAMALMKKREKMKADIEAAKNKISEVRFCEAIFEIVSSTLTFTETFVTCSFQATGYVYGVASQKRYIGQVHRFGALCTAPNSVHWCTEFGALVHRIQCTSAPNLVQKCTELGAPSALNSVH